MPHFAMALGCRCFLEGNWASSQKNEEVQHPISLGPKDISNIEHRLKQLEKKHQNFLKNIIDLGYYIRSV
jgi:hypothetical protein